MPRREKGRGRRMCQGPGSVVLAASRGRCGRCSSALVLPSLAEIRPQRHSPDRGRSTTAAIRLRPCPDSPMGVTNLARYGRQNAISVVMVRRNSGTAWFTRWHDLGSDDGAQEFAADRGTLVGFEILHLVDEPFDREVTRELHGLVKVGMQLAGCILLRAQEGAPDVGRERCRDPPECGDDACLMWVLRCKPHGDQQYQEPCPSGDLGSSEALPRMVGGEFVVEVHPRLGRRPQRRKFEMPFS